MIQLSNFDTRETSDLDLNFKMVHPATQLREGCTSIGKRHFKRVSSNEFCSSWCVFDVRRDEVRSERNIGVGIKGGSSFGFGVRADLLHDLVVKSSRAYAARVRLWLPAGSREG